MKKIKLLSILLFLFVSVFQGIAQPVEQNVKVIVAPEHSDWTYQTGERVKFNVTVLQYGNPLKNVKVIYELGPEKMQAELKDSLQLANGVHVINAGTMKTPRFYRCIAPVPVTAVLVSTAVTAPPQSSVYPLIALVALKGAAVAPSALQALVPVVPA